MSMRKLELLIDESRRATENVDFTTTSGIDTQQFIRFFNDAQRRIESKLQVLHKRIFTRTQTFSVSAQQELVPIPADVYLGTRLIHVEYARPAGTNDFYTLKKGQLQERITSIVGEPSFYIRVEDNLILQPIPGSAGTIRLTYQRKLPRLDIRRGQIETITIVGDQLTALKFDDVVDEPAFDREALIQEEELTIIDRFGKRCIENIRFDDIDEQGNVTLTGGAHTLIDGQTAAVGDFGVRGGNSTNVSELAESVERYLLQYVDWKIFKKDSSVDSQEAAQELAQMEDDIVAAYAEPDTDVDYVTILDAQYIDPENEVW